MDSVRRRLQPKMEVLGSDQEFIGEIKELREGDFLVDRPLQRDIYVPYDAIREIYVDSVTLSMPVDAVDRIGWPTTATMRHGSNRPDAPTDPEEDDGDDSAPR
jgi:hypothetical protein